MSVRTRRTIFGLLVTVGQPRPEEIGWGVETKMAERRRKISYDWYGGNHDQNDQGGIRRKD